MNITNTDAVLTKLGYTPNDTLRSQLEKIREHTPGYDKIIKHVLDLHDALQVDKSYVAMSNSTNFLKIKIEALSEEMQKEAQEKVKRFEEKYKVNLKKVEGKETYYIMGFAA